MDSGTVLVHYSDKALTFSIEIVPSTSNLRDHFFKRRQRHKMDPDVEGIIDSVQTEEEVSFY